MFKSLAQSRIPKLVIITFLLWTLNSLFFSSLPKNSRIRKYATSSKDSERYKYSPPIFREINRKEMENELLESYPLVPGACQPSNDEYAHRKINTRYWPQTEISERRYEWQSWFYNLTANMDKDLSFDRASEYMLANGLPQMLGRGIVITIRNLDQLVTLIAGIQILRKYGCNLPIEVWTFQNVLEIHDRDKVSELYKSSTPVTLRYADDPDNFKPFTRGGGSGVHVKVNKVFSKRKYAKDFQTGGITAGTPAFFVQHWVTPGGFMAPANRDDEESAKKFCGIAMMQHDVAGNVLFAHVNLLGQTEKEKFTSTNSPVGYVKKYLPIPDVDATFPGPVVKSRMAWAQTKGAKAKLIRIGDYVCVDIAEGESREGVVRETETIPISSVASDFENYFHVYLIDKLKQIERENKIE
ncbi:hypothetical protein HK098_005593 [Nowakowskiella sp. JEL0407]|nr:hypothetical protein HK098_005593 [Nowakowskiella sp. JEL0407]